MLEKIKIKLLSIHNYISKINKYKLVFFAIVLNFLFSLTFSFVSEIIFKKKHLKGFKNLGSLSDEFVLAVLIAPLCETLLFQYAVIEVIRKKLTHLFAVAFQQQYLL